MHSYIGDAYKSLGFQGPVLLVARNSKMTTPTFITDANIDIPDLLLWAQGTKLFGAVPKVSKSLQLHISRIRFDMENPRTVFLDVAQFATSLSREMLETLEVAIQADGTVLLLEGHRRFIAMLYHYRFVAKLNPTDLSACLPCEVKKSAPDGASLLSKRLRKNDERESFHPIDEARALSRLMQERQLELPVLATELGGKYTVRFIQSRLSLLLLATKAEDGIPALEYFLTGSINETEAMLVARLPKNRQLEALNKICLDQVKIRELRQWVDSVVSLLSVSATSAVTGLSSKKANPEKKKKKRAPDFVAAITVPIDMNTLCGKTILFELGGKGGGSVTAQIRIPSARTSLSISFTPDQAILGTQTLADILRQLATQLDK